MELWVDVCRSHCMP